tara:strand:+ start:71 stop:1054 length:984 start_codon:yes stop_codon:yes gene_type:complete
MKKIKKKILNFFLNRYFDKINHKKLSLKKIQYHNKILKKKYYVIATNKKKGFFSLLLFVLNHLKFAFKNKLEPIIDWQNFPTLYNDKSKMLESYDPWKYYFKKINNLNIDVIYKEGNYVFCHDKNIYTKNNSFNQSLEKTYYKHIKINNRILKKYNHYKKTLFGFDKNILGIHFRGTDMRYSPNHPLPPTEKQILKITTNLIKKHNFKKIFLVTEDLSNFNYMKIKFNDQIIYIDNFRSNKSKVFSIYPRKLHNYKMGEESLLNGLLLSNCKIVISSQTGISDFAKFLNADIKFIKIKNGINSKRILYAMFKWKIQNLLPSFLGGFK